MNKKQESQLKYAANNLTRAEQDKNLQAVAAAYKEIKETVAEIYQGKIDAPTVMGVEKILKNGQANVLGKSTGAYKGMEMLAGQAETGLRIYEAFTKRPKDYVEMAYMTRENVNRGRPFSDKIPYDPVRSALTEFREQLAQELMQHKGNLFPDSIETEKMRFHATVTAERDYLEKFLKHYDRETPERKQEHLQDFDSKMARLTRQIEPPKQEKQQEKQQEPPKQAEKQPKRSKGLSR